MVEHQTAQQEQRLQATPTLLPESAAPNLSALLASASGSNPQRQRAQPHAPTHSTQLCRFFGTKRGCRAGDQCPYRHVQTHSPAIEAAAGTDSTQMESDVAETPTGSSRAVATPSQRTKQPSQEARKPVSKPVPTLQQTNPREFQIGQVVRRFSPARQETETATVLKFKLQPSDPDFPFELAGLICVLTVPLAYPQDASPTIRVENAEMARGYQINVERGFDSLTAASPDRTLLAHLNELDKHLEEFLTSEKAQTIKIVANPRKADSAQPVRPPSPPALITHLPSPSPAPSFSAKQKTDALVKREADIQQLEARMSRVPLFSKSSNQITFDIPLTIPKPGRLPTALQSVKQLVLTVPKLYNLECCTIKLKGVSGAQSENVELGWERHAKAHPELTLMALINYLTQNMHLMAETTSPQAVVTQLEAPPLSRAPVVDEAKASSEKQAAPVGDEDRPHVIRISRPPEWDRPRDDSDGASDSTESYGSEDEDHSQSEDEAEGGASLPAQATHSTAERGVLVSFPHLELYGIELLELRSISLTVKCDRCKADTDIANVKASESSTSTSTLRTEGCRKCASTLGVRYRAEPMHINSIKAGYLDLEICSVVDMLPSLFVPTCSTCSTAFDQPGTVAVRGDSPLHICRECHGKLSFKIPELKFLRVSSAADPRLHQPLPPKRQKDTLTLGITAGTELPAQGRCKHYSKSYRWFRFSCCARVYPCDRCHDAQEQHPNEHANRMLCGWCSREQNYRPEDCGVCGRSVVRKRMAGGGFWEGGKGTRDQGRMRRKDTRKFKRVGGSQK